MTSRISFDWTLVGERTPRVFYVFTTSVLLFAVSADNVERILRDEIVFTGANMAATS